MRAFALNVKKIQAGFLGLVFFGFVKMAEGQSVTVLHSFGDGSVANDAQFPTQNLIQGSDGNFYGVSSGGGGNSLGCVYKMTAQKQIVVLHSFAAKNDGEYPSASLVQGTDGNFYGTTYGGGANNQGCVYQMTPQGGITILHSFGDGSVTNDGNYPSTGLVLGTDGNFYGTTSSGGSASQGCIYKVTLQGAVTILHSFGDGSVTNDGVYGASSLVQGTDSSFYGTTVGGGSAGGGCVYKVTSQGAVTILHSFADGSVTNDGFFSGSNVILSTDGNFYGTTNNGGSAGGGCIYKMTSQGQVTILHSFGDGTVANDGSYGASSLIRATDGNFYGTVSNGGAANEGCIYRVTPQGQVVIFHSFGDGTIANDGNGISGTSSLVQGTDGNLYGVTYGGGSASKGTLFTVTLSAPLITSSLAVASTSGTSFSYQVIATNNPTTYAATGLPPGFQINSHTGLITGTTTSTGTYHVTLSISNTQGTSTQILTLSVEPPVIATDTPTLPQWGLMALALLLMATGARFLPKLLSANS